MGVMNELSIELEEIKERITKLEELHKERTVTVTLDAEEVRRTIGSAFNEFLEDCELEE